MSKAKFIELFQETLEMEDEDIKQDDIFREYSEWDSLAVLSVLAMVNEEYDIIIPRKEFEVTQTIEELYNLIQAKK